MPAEHRDDEDRPTPYNNVLVSEQGVNCGGGYTAPLATTDIPGYRSTAVMVADSAGGVTVRVTWTFADAAGSPTVYEEKVTTAGVPQTLFFLNQGDQLVHVKLTGGGGSTDYAVVESNQLPLPPKTLPAGARCKLLGKGNGTDTITITLTAPVPADGVLQVVLMQATIGDALDTASQPNNVSDSKAVAGWVWPATATVQPIIGPIRETLSGSGPATTSQALSVARLCTTGDLVVGDTITITYTTADPLLFHTCGLVIWQRAFFETIKQFGAVMYANGDDHPGSGASLTTMSWNTDYGPNTTNPDRDALVLTAMGAYPAVAGFSPLIGTVIGEIATGSVSVAAACYNAQVGEGFDPGGSWPAGAIQLAGNYQTVYPRTFSSVI